jgi:2-polyprenyl-6-methoxyphenol hydroxylase-like FAD-dependent oxidoreductase
LLIDSGIVAALQSLGVDVSNFTPATDFTFIDADAGLLYQFPLAAEFNPRGHSSVWSLFPRRTPCADVLISELEQVLLGVIEDEPDIEILQGVEIKSIQSAGKQQVLFTHQDSECCLSAEVIAVCDGARTATPRLGLGVNWAIRDAIRFGKLLPGIRSHHRAIARWAAWTYRFRTRVASEVLLFQGWISSMQTIAASRAKSQANGTARGMIAEPGLIWNKWYQSGTINHASKSQGTHQHLIQHLIERRIRGPGRKRQPPQFPPSTWCKHNAERQTGRRCQALSGSGC